MELPWKNQPEASGEVCSTGMTVFVEVLESFGGICYYFRGSFHGSSFHGSSTQILWKNRSFVEVFETSRGSCYYFRGSFDGSSFHGSSTTSMKAVDASPEASMEASEYFRGRFHPLPCKWRKLSYKWWKLPWKHWKLLWQLSRASTIKTNKNAEDRVRQIEDFAETHLVASCARMVPRLRVLQVTVYLLWCSFAYIQLIARWEDGARATAVELTSHTPSRGGVLLGPNMFSGPYGAPRVTIYLQSHWLYSSCFTYYPFKCLPPTAHCCVYI